MSLVDTGECCYGHKKSCDCESYSDEKTDIPVYFFHYIYTKCFLVFTHFAYTFFIVVMTPLESKLRTLFDVPASSISPENRIQHLGAFWPHWTLHKRKCDVTHRDIISVFRPECPYPVWHKDEWFKNARPPQAQFDFSQGFFPQSERLFKQCPIAHNIGSNNENCEYTDDAWSSKDCYLCHSMFESEQARYNLKGYWSVNSMYIVASYKCERCISCTNCHTCFECIESLNLKNCRNVAFSFDCSGCSDCLFCYNLRNKQYCIGNKQYSREQFEAQKKNFDYSTLSGHRTCQTFFEKILKERAYFRSLYFENTESVHGNYLDEAKNVENTYFMSRIEDVVNCMRGTMAKTCLDCVSSYDAEKMYMCSAVQLKCYDVMFSFQLMEARFVAYSAYSAQLENCFGCCGLVRGKNCILNTPYSPQEYVSLRTKIVDHMKSTGEWGCFFPGSFSPNPYDESWSSFYFPIGESEQKQQ